MSWNWRMRRVRIRLRSRSGGRIKMRRGGHGGWAWTGPMSLWTWGWPIHRTRRIWLGPRVLGNLSSTNHLTTQHSPPSWNRPSNHLHHCKVSTLPRTTVYAHRPPAFDAVSSLPFILFGSLVWLFMSWRLYQLLLALLSQAYRPLQLYGGSNPSSCRKNNTVIIDAAVVYSIVIPHLSYPLSIVLVSLPVLCWLVHSGLILHPVFCKYVLHLKMVFRNNEGNEREDLGNINYCEGFKKLRSMVSLPAFIQSAPPTSNSSLITSYVRL